MFQICFSSCVSIVEPPRIITHPQKLKDSIAGNPAKFTIQAIGTEPLNYYWQWKTIEKRAESREWQPCDEGWCDRTTLTIPSVQKLNEGSYCCVISNSAGSQISKVAQLSVGKDAMFKCLKSVKCVLVSTRQQKHPSFIGHLSNRWDLNSSLLSNVSVMF